MDFECLLDLTGDDPVFESALLLAGDVKSQNIRLQLSRWTKSGRIYQLRRGLYAVAPPYQKTRPQPFVIANRLQRASYVSLQSALAFYGLIPDVVTVTSSITTRRPEQLKTPLGDFYFRHVRSGLLFGYRMIDLGGQQALVATAEKALLDLVYLQPGGENLDYLRELRLQNLENLDLDHLHQQASKFEMPKLMRAAKAIAHLAQQEQKEYKTL